MGKSCLLAVVLALNFLSVSAVNASIVLFEWGVNIDGAVSFPSLGDPVPSGVNVAGFDDNTGLGVISVTITGAGSHTFDAFFDHDIIDVIGVFEKGSGNDIDLFKVLNDKPGSGITVVDRDRLKNVI